MNRATKRRRRRILFPLILLPAIMAGQVRAKTPTPQNPVKPARTQPQAQANQPGKLKDFAELNFTPDKIQKIRAVLKLTGLIGLRLRLGPRRLNRILWRRG